MLKDSSMWVKSMEVETIGHFILLLKTIIYLDLKRLLLYRYLDEI